MPFSYDAIADVYATDMGRSMPFGDVGWYRDVSLANGGRVLELGCGTGRILIELLRSGIDAVGADRSLPMLRRLRRDAAAAGISPSVLQMDIAQPALTGRFRTILLPYSLITYVTDPARAVDVVRGLRPLLGDDGRLVLDAFVPRPVVSFAEFRQDYRRPHGTGELERHKRITANADGTNRIERRYRVLEANGAELEEFVTDETIRPYTPEDLVAIADRAGFQVVATAWDYAAEARPHDARFATLTLRPRS